MFSKKYRTLKFRDFRHMLSLLLTLKKSNHDVFSVKSGKKPGPLFVKPGVRLRHELKSTDY